MRDDYSDYVSAKTHRRCSEDDGGDGFKFKVAHVMTVVDNAASLLAEKKVLRSRALTCPDDPESTRFEVQLQFGCEEENFLSAFFVPLNGYIRTGMTRFIIYDDNFKKICSDAFAHESIIDPISEFGFFSLHSLINVGEMNWTVMCELHYDPVLYMPLDSDQWRERERTENKLSTDMHSLLKDQTDADVKFCVENEGHVTEIKAHKPILIARSAYFQNLFKSGMKESVSKEIKIEESPVLFNELLRFVYSGQPPENLRKIAIELLPLADRYGLDELKELCASALQQEVTEDNVIDILLLAETLHLPELVRYCAPLFQSYAKTLESGSHWSKLDNHPHLLKKLLVYCCE